MITLTYPTNSELREIAQDKIPLLARDRTIFEIMPMRDLDSALLMWEQKDNWIGLQQIRGMNGAPPRVKAQGAKRFIMAPGVYGEFELIDELEITMRRPLGVYNGPIPVEDLVMEKQDKLLGRRLDRIEYIGWALLTTGTFSVAAPNGAVLHTDTFPVQTFSAGVTWSTSATAVPIANFRAVQLLSRGHSVSFGPQSIAYMNQTTFNNFIGNGNTNDLYGRRTSGLATINNMKDLNTLLTGDGLPGIKIYDLGYLDETGTFQKWIPDNVVIVVGQRPQNQVVAEYLMTRNANNPNGEAGAYQKVVDDPNDVPRSIEIHDGHNGGPAIYFPSAIVRMNV